MFGCQHIGDAVSYSFCHGCFVEAYPMVCVTTSRCCAQFGNDFCHTCRFWSIVMVEGVVILA